MANERAFEILNDAEDIEDVSSKIVFARSAGQARAEFALESGLEFIKIRVRRAKWADQYQSPEKIPAEAWLKEGYGVVCDLCGEFVYEDDEHVVGKNGDGYFCAHSYCMEKSFMDQITPTL